MDHLTQIILAVFASTGFWALVQAIVIKLMDRRSAERAALLGLLHERLVEQCESYLDRGYATEGEIRDLEEYISRRIAIWAETEQARKCSTRRAN